MFFRATIAMFFAGAAMASEVNQLESSNLRQRILHGCNGVTKKVRVTQICVNFDMDYGADIEANLEIDGKHHWPSGKDKCPPAAGGFTDEGNGYCDLIDEACNNIESYTSSQEVNGAKPLKIILNEDDDWFTDTYNKLTFSSNAWCVDTDNPYFIKLYHSVDPGETEEKSCINISASVGSGVSAGVGFEQCDYFTPPPKNVEIFVEVLPA